MKGVVVVLRDANPAEQLTQAFAQRSTWDLCCAMDVLTHRIHDAEEKAKVDLRRQRDLIPRRGVPQDGGASVNGPESGGTAAFKKRTAWPTRSPWGPIPDSLPLDHVRARGCVRHDCCNPAHLEPVTQRENNARTAKPTCGRGHPKTPNHGRQRGTKWRCVTCEVITQRARRAKRAGT